MDYFQFLAKEINDQRDRLTAMCEIHVKQPTTELKRYIEFLRKQLNHLQAEHKKLDTIHKQYYRVEMDCICGYSVKPFHRTDFSDHNDYTLHLNELATLLSSHMSTCLMNNIVTNPTFHIDHPNPLTHS